MFSEASKFLEIRKVSLPLSGLPINKQLDPNHNCTINAKTMREERKKNETKETAYLRCFAYIDKIIISSSERKKHFVKNNKSYIKNRTMSWK